MNTPDDGGGGDGDGTKCDADREDANEGADGVDVDATDLPPPPPAAAAGAAAGGAVSWVFGLLPFAFRKVRVRLLVVPAFFTGATS